MTRLFTALPPSALNSNMAKNEQSVFPCEEKRKREEYKKKYKKIKRERERERRRSMIDGRFIK